MTTADNLKELNMALARAGQAVESVSGSDAVTVRELIGRFQGRQGMYLLQTGPGFTRRHLAPSQSPLAPRVLHFANTYEPDDDDSAVPDGDD